LGGSNRVNLIDPNDPHFGNEGQPDPARGGVTRQPKIVPRLIAQKNSSAGFAGVRLRSAPDGEAGDDEWLNLVEQEPP